VMVIAGVLVFFAVIAGLMYLDRRRESKTKHAH